MHHLTFLHVPVLFSLWSLVSLRDQRKTLSPTLRSSKTMRETWIAAWPSSWLTGFFLFLSFGDRILQRTKSKLGIRHRSSCLRRPSGCATSFDKLKTYRNWKRKSNPIRKWGRRPSRKHPKSPRQIQEVKKRSYFYLPCLSPLCLACNVLIPCHKLNFSFHIVCLRIFSEITMKIGFAIQDMDQYSRLCGSRWKHFDIRLRTPNSPNSIKYWFLLKTLCARYSYSVDHNYHAIFPTEKRWAVIIFFFKITDSTPCIFSYIGEPSSSVTSSGSNPECLDDGFFNFLNCCKGWYVKMSIIYVSFIRKCKFVSKRLLLPQQKKWRV